ncbi:MAG TPA: glutathione S-transferase [Polyangiaceae bacterium]|nr:glutathione S-transferase [Polyangiaceae bacterium]
MKLYRFSYSPFARKVQMVLELLGRPHELVDVPYSDRDELASVTGGYIAVPVWVSAGEVTYDSRRICERLLADDAAHTLAPSPLEGPIWAYADFCDGPLEDVLFRVASPALREHKASPGDRALFTFIKERKFGAGCVEQWRRDQGVLLDRARQLLAPTLRTLAQVPFLFGAAPTLADAALYGNLAMLHEADAALPSQLAPAFPAYMARLEAARRSFR